MSTSSFKKISAAAVAVVLGLSAVSHGATLYSTGFEPAPAVPAYTPGALNTQNSWAFDTAADGASSASQTAGSATAAQVVTAGAISGTQSVQLSTGTGTTGAPEYNDFQNAFTGATAINGLTTTVSLNTSLTPSDGGNGVGLSIVNTLTDSTVAGFLITEHHNEDAGGATIPGYHTVEELYDGASGSYNGSIGSNQNPAADGATGVYSLTLYPGSNIYTVTAGGQTFQENLPAGLTGAGLSVDFTSISTGTAGTGTFDDLSVSVPEPASCAMVSLGGLLLLAKRPKRLA